MQTPTLGGMSDHNDTGSGNAVIAFIGGGNMASALIGGLVKTGTTADRIRVVEPHEPQRLALLERLGVQAQAAADAALGEASVVVWAVKPQLFAEASRPCALHVRRVSTVRRSSARNSADCISLRRETVRGNSCASGPSV